MKPAYNPMTRRQFLVGGGVALAVPLLPSLLPREVRAAAQAAVSAERYFVHMTTWHGVFQSQFFGPLLDLAPTQKTFAGGIEVRGMPLKSRADGSNIVISDILTAASSALTPRMLSRMNVINGLDFHTGVGHNRGYSLGGDDVHPSIDQVLARSAGFYPTRPSQGVIVRNLVSLSSAGSGTTQTEQTAESNVKLFDRLFGTTTTPGEPSIVLVDRVKEHADLVMADPACSTDCRNRLSNYLDLLSDVQTQVGGVANGGGSFPRPTTDTAAVEATEGFYGKPEQQVACERLWNDIVAAAFAAGISRAYVCGPNTYTFGPDSEHAWHNNYAHALDDPAKRAGFNAAVRLQFEGAMLDMANRLDRITTADGATIFDKTLIASGFELGSGGNPGHHHNRCVPVVTLGNAGGYFKTGQYLDYRDLDSFTWSSDPHWYSGLLYNQWMGMVLRSMGVSRAEQETGIVGYPNLRGPNGDHTDQIWNVAGQDLPWLKA
ncbi:hypothetical protein [Ideonella sp. YS5]|uniref:hypothetical protein n=1 Tax=Ideonella sp. YS5 TaxID=3453714 RepID=UPI003EEC4250